MADNQGTDPIDATDPEGDEGQGLGRRQALGLFGAATAAAWAAPQIISVPAASAATFPGGPAAAVAVGAGGAVIVSAVPPGPGAPVVGNAVPEGWTSVGPIGSTTLNGITSNGLNGDSTWVAVGSSGMAYVSDDSTATTWTPHITTTESTLHAITWTGSSFLAVGDEGRVIVSSDGLSWTTVLFGFPQAPPFLGVACDGTTVVAVGGDGIIMSAAVSDLGVWTSEFPPAQLTLTAVTASGNGIFAAVGMCGPIPTEFTIVVRAADGTWTAGATGYPGLADLYAVATSSSGDVMGAGGSVAEFDVRNQDPPDYTTTWSVGGPRETVLIRAMAAIDVGGFVAVGLGGQIAIVDSDFELTEIPSPTTADLNAVATDWQ